MKQQNNLKLLLILYCTLLLLFVGLFIHERHQKNVISEINTKNINELNDSLKTYKGQYGQIVSEKGVIQADLKEIEFQNDSLKDVIANFKEPEKVVILKTVFKVDSIYVPTYDTIAKDLPIKRAFRFDDPFFEFSGFLMNNNDIIVKDLQMYNDIYMVLGDKKVGKWYNRDTEYKINAYNTNPYIKTSDITVYTLRVEEKWYNNPFIVGGAGFGAGLLTGLILK